MKNLYIDSCTDECYDYICKAMCLHIYERACICVKNIIYYIRIGVKLCFSLILLQLLYVSLCVTGDVDTALYTVPEMLEYCAASASLTFAGAYILEYQFTNRP